MNDIERLLAESGLAGITPDTGLPVIEDQLRALVAKLNGADPLRRATIRQMLVDRLKDAKVEAAARLVDAALGIATPTAADTTQGQAVAFGDPEPWSEVVNGAELLERIQAFIGRFLGLPPGADVLLAAFTVYTYAAEAFAAAPYLVAHSPAPQCGKTRLLEVLALLVRRPWLTIVPSTAVLFRVLEGHSPTLLLDEAEVVRGRGDAAQDVRALLQSGYRRGAFVPRCVGEANEVRNFRVFGPKAFALIGELPPALFDRCIPIEMQRRARGEQLARFRPARLEAEALTLCREARRWAQDHREVLAGAEPPALPFLEERAEEVWGPLVAIGVVAGGGWDERLREAARGLSGGRATTSVGLELLTDIRAVFEARGVERIASADLATALNALEGHRWAAWNNDKGTTPNGVARLLRSFGVAPTSDGVSRGYKREAFAILWDQYLQPSNRQEPSNGAAESPAGNRQTELPADGCGTPGNPHGDCIPDGLTVQMQGGVGPGLFDGDVPPGEPDPDEAMRAALREPRDTDHKQEWRR